MTGGERRGAKLYSVTGEQVRPALARVRKSLFDIIGPGIEGAMVVDLFGGTGSLVLESLSRGAAEAVLFEIDANCASAIRRNLEKLGYADRALLLEHCAFGAPEWLEEVGKVPDLVFVDPPYSIFRDEGECSRLLEMLGRLPMCDGGRMILEHRSVFDPPDRIGARGMFRNKKYGGTTLSFYG